jgi:hypothetical protein
MIAILSLLTVVAILMLATRIGSIALALTGLSEDLARFQARSALTGVGFTTHESEQVVNHPVRRRILMLLMLMGNAGIVATVSSMIVSFVNLRATTVRDVLVRLAFLFLGLIGLCLLARSRWLNRRISRIIGWCLKRWTSLVVRDYSSLLHLSDNYGVSEIQVEADDWLAEKTLAELELSAEGLLVLSIRHADGEFIGTPLGESLIRAGDRLILYGREEQLADLDERRKGVEGDDAHRRGVAAQKREDEAVKHREETRIWALPKD